MKRRVFIERIPGIFASIYEKATRLAVKGYYAQVAGEVVSYLNSGTILDLGTGPGYLSLEIVKRSVSIRVDGIDLGRRLIDIARLNALKANVADRLHFRTANAAKLPFDDNYYDMVISTGMLHMLKDPVKVLRESYRVLKPGGEAWIYDPAQISSQIDIGEWKASLSSLEKVICTLYTLYARISPPQGYNRKEVLEMIVSTDFKEYHIEERDKEIRMKLIKKKAGII